MTNISNLDGPMSNDQVAHMGISFVEQLLFKRQTSHDLNLMHKLLYLFLLGKHCRPL